MNNRKKSYFNRDDEKQRKKRIEELKKKISSPEYMSFAMEKIASDLTHLLFR